MPDPSGNTFGAILPSLMEFVEFQNKPFIDSREKEEKPDIVLVFEHISVIDEHQMYCLRNVDRSCQMHIV